MPNPHIVTDGKTFKTDQGGCRPPTDDEKKRIPHMPQDVLDKIRAKAKAKRDGQLLTGTSKVEQYNSVHWDDNQGGTGCCTAGAANVLEMACGLFLQNIKIPHPSLGFGYYSSTKDATFRYGWSVSGAIYARTGATNAFGCCANAFYSQDWLLTQFQIAVGFPFNASQLPQPAAYADAKTRTVLQYHSIPSRPADMSVIDDLLDTGHPIGFGMGNHAMCFIDRSADGWLYYAKDSNRADMDLGSGRGIRGFTRDAVASSAFDLVTVTLIEPGSLSVSTGNTQMLIDTIKDDANGLVLGQISQTQVDKIKADVAMLVADAPTTQPPPNTETVWSDDTIPSGAIANKTPNTINEPWLWVTANPAPYSGAKAHQSEIRAGVHQHYWQDAPPFAIGANDKLFAYVYLDPANPPTQIILMWYGNSTWNYAYWGANNTPGGVYVGPLPAVGAWVRLEVAASAVGLAGKSAIGMSFRLFDGRATWDRCGKLS